MVTKYNKQKKEEYNTDEESSDEDYLPDEEEEEEEEYGEEEEEEEEVKPKRVKEQPRVSKRKLDNLILLMTKGQDKHEENSSESCDDEEDNNIEDIEDEYMKQEDFTTNLKDMVELYKKYKHRKNMKYLKAVERKLEQEQQKFKEIEEKRHKQLSKKQYKEFKKLFETKVKHEEDDVEYFKSLSNEEQKLCIQQLKFLFTPNECKEYLSISDNVDHVLSYLTNELNKLNQNKISLFKGEIYDKSPILYRILRSDVPYNIKQKMMKDYETLSNMDDENSNEYHKRQLYLNTLLKIPFGKYQSLPIQFNGTNREECSKFITDTRTHLDKVIYGMDHVKTQIMQIIAQWLVNPNSVSSAIALKGPPGTGKTSIIKHGISKVLKRPFAFIPLGGVSDGCFLDGHSYTYDGSRWGKIVDVLTTSNCMNPVFYFDELDKISDTPKGDEINGILTHLTDTTQNTQFNDKYFSDIDFNLSKSLFIFSYNHEHRINSILKDRLYVIETKGYTEQEKLNIAQIHFIPLFEQTFNLKLKFKNDIIQYIIKTYTNDEQGVRNLKRCIEQIYSKMNLYSLGQYHLIKNIKKTIEFPCTITNHIVDQLLKPTHSTYTSYKMMYM